MKKEYLDTDDILDFLNKDCQRFRDVLNFGDSSYSDPVSEIKSDYICLTTTLDSFKKSYVDSEVKLKNEIKELRKNLDKNENLFCFDVYIENLKDEVGIIYGGTFRICARLKIRKII